MCRLFFLTGCLKTIALANSALKNDSNAHLRHVNCAFSSLLPCIDPAHNIFQQPAKRRKPEYSAIKLKCR